MHSVPWPISLPSKLLHSLRGVLASTSKLHGVELYLLSGDGQTLASFEFDRDDDAPAINVGAKLLRIGAVARVLDEQKPVFIPDLAQEMLKHPDLASVCTRGCRTEHTSFSRLYIPETVRPSVDA